MSNLTVTINGYIDPNNGSFTTFPPNIVGCGYYWARDANNSVTATLGTGVALNWSISSTSPNYITYPGGSSMTMNVMGEYWAGLNVSH
jgi:hypothetical protein